MSHPTWQVFGTFDEPVNAYRGMQMGHVMVQDDYAPDPRRGCARGFILISYMMTPATYALLSGTFVGAELKDFLHDYAHTAAWWAHAEGLPDERNAITLDPDLRDARGLPVARVTYEWGENDVRLSAAARDRAIEMWPPAHAKCASAQLRRTRWARAGWPRPRTSVVNEFGRRTTFQISLADTALLTGSG
jgi:hypothetical protein